MARKLSEISQAERLQIGKRIHEEEWQSRDDAAAAIGIHRSTTYALLKAYRDSIGFLSPNQVAAQANNAKRIATRMANRAKREKAEARKAAKAAKANGHTNGTNGHAAPALVTRTELATIPDRAKDAHQIAELKERLADAQDQLAHAMDEVHTLQKILMVVGKTL